MKNASRIIMAAAIVLLMVFSAAVPGFAADDDGKIIIENHNEAVSMANHTYEAYRIFADTVDATGNHNYTLTDAFKPYFEDANNVTLTDDMGEDIDAQAYTYVSTCSDLPGFAKAIYEWATGGSVNIDPTGDVTVTDATATSAEIKDLPYGYYLVYDKGTSNTGAEAGEQAIANIALTTAVPEGTIVLKASVPSIEKKITGASDTATNAASDTGEAAVSAEVGKHISFQIDSAVPDLTNYTAYTYEVKDTMSASLDPDKNVKVTIGTDELTAGTDYSVTYSGQVTTVTVFFDTLKRYDKDTPITITYSAQLTADATVYPSATPNSNSAVLTYSNKVDDTSSTGSTPPSTVQAHLFPLVISKINPDNEGLAGAEFTLKDKDGNLVVFVQDATNANKYTVSTTETATDDNTKVTSGDDGKIYISGLVAGEYTLTETKAPDTYNKLKETIAVNIVPTYNDEDGSVVSVSGTAVSVVNRSGQELPSTGGIGTIIFTVGGAAIMITAAVLLIKRKKTAAE